MVYKNSFSRKLFIVCNALLLGAITFLCIVPFVHLLAVSLSSNTAAMAAEVKLWPIGFTLDAYAYLGQKVEFFRSLWVTLQRVVLGTAINMLLVVLSAYPLSKEAKQFRFRTLYVWFFAVTMFFGGSPGG